MLQASMEKSLVMLQQKKAVILTTDSLSVRAIFENEKTLGTTLSHLAAENEERLPSVMKTRKFRREFKWNGLSWWKFSGKKNVIPFEVLPFSRFYRNDRNFLYHLLGLPVPSFKSRESEKSPVFCKYYNSILFLFSVPKKYQCHLTEIFY